jgi:hypothetical protein
MLTEKRKVKLAAKTNQSHLPRLPDKGATQATFPASLEQDIALLESSLAWAGGLD